MHALMLPREADVSRCVSPLILRREEGGRERTDAEYVGSDHHAHHEGGKDEACDMVVLGAAAFSGGATPQSENKRVGGKRKNHEAARCRTGSAWGST